MSIRFVRFTLAGFALILVGSGCASTRAEKKVDPRKAVQAAPVKPVFVGTVALVNTEREFVLIDTGLFPSPAPGSLLKSYTHDRESAELTTSAVQKRPFTIADIKSGQPSKGDRVFVAGQATSPPPAGAPAPAPALPPAPEFLPPVQLSTAR